jgi:hypothetical protein
MLLRQGTLGAVRWPASRQVPVDEKTAASQCSLVLTSLLSICPMYLYA